MTPVLSLLIPIVVSAVFVFLASSVIHMATPFHKNDLKKFPNEDDVMKALRGLGLRPGAPRGGIVRLRRPARGV